MIGKPRYQHFENKRKEKKKKKQYFPDNNTI